jgi:hypothetical protein
MVPKIHPLTLTFDCNSRKGGPLKADNVSSRVSSNDGFYDNVIPPSLPCTRQEMLAEEESQCACQENKNE